MDAAFDAAPPETALILVKFLPLILRRGRSFLNFSLITRRMRCLLAFGRLASRQGHLSEMATRAKPGGQPQSSNSYNAPMPTGHAFMLSLTADTPGVVSVATRIAFRSASEDAMPHKSTTPSLTVTFNRSVFIQVRAVPEPGRKPPTGRSCNPFLAPSLSARSRNLCSAIRCRMRK